MLEARGRSADALDIYREHFSSMKPDDGRTMALRLRFKARMAGCLVRLGNALDVIAIEKLRPTREEYPGSGLDEEMVQSVADLLKNQANALMFLGRFDEAKRCLEEALELCSGIGDRIRVGTLDNNLGALWQYQGESERAAECYGRALEIYESTGYAYGQAMTSNNLGETKMDLLRFEEAEGHLLRSQRISRLIGTKDVLPDTLRLLAMVQLETGRLAEALETSKLSLDMAEESGSLQYRAGAHFVQGLIAACAYRDGGGEGLLAEARTHVVKAFRLCDEGGLDMDKKRMREGMLAKGLGAILGDC